MPAPGGGVYQPQAGKGQGKKRKAEKELERAIKRYDRTMGTSSPQADAQVAAPQSTPPEADGKGKGKNGPGYSGWKAGASNWSDKEKKWKCFKFQRGHNNCPGCNLAHRCLVCDDTHPMAECPKRPPKGKGKGGTATPSGDAAGSAQRIQ